MNFGFASLDGRECRPHVHLRLAEKAEWLHVQLYDRVVGMISLRNRDVLEVGCGRGGGASYLMRYHQPRSVVGLDLSKRGIAFCGRRHALPGLSFCVGDAEALPLADASFDTVVNVESSHCYVSMEQFLSEVSRVLRYGGHFLFSDMRISTQVSQLRMQLDQSGLAVLEREDITPNVLKAMDLDSERRLTMIRREAPRALHGMLSSFVGIQGTHTYQALRSGTLRYVRYLLEKPGP